MKTPLIFGLNLAMMVPFAPVVEANVIERACNQSDRRAATPQLCDCIGVAADLTLDRADQRQAARFFRDPQRAQDTRMSDRRSDDLFWDRYVAFGETAEAMCG